MRAGFTGQDEATVVRSFVPASAQPAFAENIASSHDRLDDLSPTTAAEPLAIELARPVNSGATADRNGPAHSTHGFWHDATGIDSLLPTLVGVWLAGVVFLSCRHLGGWWVVTRLRGHGELPRSPSLVALTAALGQRLGIRYSVMVFESLSVQVPSTVGWLRPALLLPLGLASRLPPDQLEAILLHELAHILRRDYLANGLQLVAETLLFYHPGVWWVSRRMRLEREHCADELAATACGNRLLYANALTTLEEQRACLPGCAVAANGSDLRRRIELVLGVDRHTPGQAMPWITGLITFLLLAVAAGSFPWRESNAEDNAPVAVAEGDGSTDARPTKPSLQATTPSALPPETPSGEVVGGATTAPQLWRSAVPEEPSLRGQLRDSLAYMAHDFLEAAFAPAAPIVREYCFQVQSTDGQPVTGATVTFTGLGLPGGSTVGGFPDDLVSTATSDADGMVGIDLSGFYDSQYYAHLSGQLRRGIQTIHLRVDHAHHPPLTTDVWVADAPAPGIRKIVLAEAQTIEIRARREGEETLLRGLYPRLRGADGNWSETDGVLTISRLDLTSSKASRWLRVVHVLEQGPVLFSDVIDLKQYAGDPISIEAVLRPGVQVRGRLSKEIPRPVRDGRIMAAVYSGPDASDTVFWGDTAEIAPDGSFVLGPLPADEDAQLIAFCDGWVSRSPTEAEVRAYVETHGFELRIPYVPSQHFGMLYPRLHRLSQPASHTVIPMERTSACEVTVVDEDGKSIPEATVSFSQNQAFFRSGTFELGAGLRYLDLRTSLTGPGSIGLADAEIEALLRTVPSAGRLPWMLEHYALPLETSGISKVLIYLVQELAAPPPIVVPLTPEHREGEEGMAEVFQPVDVPAFVALSLQDKQTYLLDLIHAALVRCAEHFRWNRQPLDAARERILEDDFQFEFDWKKPLSSPNRKHKVQARLVVTDQLHIWLIFYDRSLNEISRKLLCTDGVGSGIAKFALHRIAWRDAETVCVTQENNRDYWLCTISGEPEFHYPRAERGDPHGLYDLGLFYLEGRFVARDPVRARELIEAAACQGFVPAKRWLARVGQGE